MKGIYLTHNHPIDSSFSKADIQVFAGSGLSEIRAVTKTRSFIMKSNKHYTNKKEFSTLKRDISKSEKKVLSDLSTRLKYMILSVNGETENAKIREFVDNYLLARDSRSFREHLRKTQPDIVMEFDYIGENGVEEDAVIPMTAGFVWPDD